MLSVELGSGERNLKLITHFFSLTLINSSVPEHQCKNNFLTETI